MKPTSDPDLNAVLEELVTRVRTILGPNFVGAYLQGSFALGDWDSHSDVDFLVIIDPPLSDAEPAALQEMHGRIYDRPSPWAQHLEGSYLISQETRFFWSLSALFWLNTRYFMPKNRVSQSEQD